MGAHPLRHFGFLFFGPAGESEAHLRMLRIRCALRFSVFWSGGRVGGASPDASHPLRPSFFYFSVRRTGGASPDASHPSMSRPSAHTCAFGTCAPTPAGHSFVQARLWPVGVGCTCFACACLGGTRKKNDPLQQGGSFSFARDKSRQK